MQNVTLTRQEIGARLKELRGDKTLKQVGDDLNVTSMAVSNWENGERTPNDDMKVKIANYYGVSVGSLFFN